MKRLTLILITVFCFHSSVYTQIACNEFTKEDIDVVAYDCDTKTVSFCLPFINLMQYEIHVNGISPTEYGTCGETNVRLSYLFDYSFSLNSPINLEAWSVNGNIFSGDLDSIDELLDSMNVWATPDIWEFNEDFNVMITENPSNQYANLELTDPATNIFYELSFDVLNLPSSVSFATSIESNYFIEIFNIQENCIDSIFIENSEINGMVDCPDFAPLGAQWFFTDYSIQSNSPDITRVVSDRDTSITNFQEFEGSTRIIEVYKNDSYIPQARTYLLEVDGKVYYFEYDQFVLLYDFNLEAGDIMFPQTPTNRTFYDFHCTNDGNVQYFGQVQVNIDSVSFTEVQGEQLKVLHTSTADYGGYYDCIEFGKITERIGSEYGLFGRNCTQCLAGFPGEIKCYSDEVIEFAVDDFDCGFGLDTSTKTVGDFEFEIYPNPTDGALHLDTDIEVGAIRIVDLMGLELLYMENQIDDTLSLSMLESGVYFLQVMDTKGNLVGVKKVVKR